MRDFDLAPNSVAVNLKNAHIWQRCSPICSAVQASTAARARTPERARVHENALGTLLISPMYLYMREKRNVGAR